MRTNNVTTWIKDTLFHSILKSLVSQSREGFKFLEIANMYEGVTSKVSIFIRDLDDKWW